MKSDKYFGTTIDCPCGKTHVIAPNELVYAPDAVDQLPAVARRTVGDKSNHACVLMDTRTQTVAGQPVSQALKNAGWNVRPIVVRDREAGKSPICDEPTRDDLLGEIGDADLLVAVGGGVMSDLAKWVGLERNLPVIIFATAASMNGYTSANIAPTISGVKSLVYGQPARAILACPTILAEAPQELTAAGLGDVLAKSISSADWYLNHLLFDDYYCSHAVALVADVEPLYMEHPEDLRTEKSKPIAGLFDALLLTGVGMTMAGTSAPASGGEHLISHALDMLSTVDGIEHDLHGRQVGVGTILTAELYRRVLATESPTLPEPKPQIDSAIWGPLSSVVGEQYTEKLPRLHKSRALLSAGGAWDRLRAELSSFPRPPEVIHNCLQRGGAATGATDIGCDRNRLVSALRNANEIRSRFTILDLGYLTGVLPYAAEEIVQQWA